ncbi:hypothetical protein Q3G72_011004 [Acer saccharum]|nr:hypothetical protein Q3G72_011004 [Acer saccharum]
MSEAKKTIGWWKRQRIESKRVSSQTAGPRKEKRMAPLKRGGVMKQIFKQASVEEKKIKKMSESNEKQESRSLDGGSSRGISGDRNGSSQTADLRREKTMAPPRRGSIIKKIVADFFPSNSPPPS